MVNGGSLGRLATKCEPPVFLILKPNQERHFIKLIESYVAVMFSAKDFSNQLILFTHAEFVFYFWHIVNREVLILEQ